MDLTKMSLEELKALDKVMATMALGLPNLAPEHLPADERRVETLMDAFAGRIMRQLTATVTKKPRKLTFARNAEGLIQSVVEEQP